MNKRTYSIEQQLLFVLFTNGYLLTKCPLTPEDFSTETNRIIYQAMVDVDKQHKPIDIISIAEHIESTYRNVDMEYLGNIFEKGVGVATSFDNYVNIIRETSRKNKGKQIAWNLQQQLEENFNDYDPIQAAIQELMKVDSNKQSYDKTIKECLEAGLKCVQDAHNSGGLVGIPTGLKSLDEAIGGYHDSDLYVFGARPAMGKTAFLFCSALANDVCTGIISAEQGHAQAGLRFISISGSVHSQNMRSANLSEAEWSRVSAGTINAQKKNIFLNDEPGISITSLIKQARLWKFNNNLQILFVDYIQKIKGTNPNAKKYEQVTEVVGALKQLARELDIPVVALAQVKRDVDTRTDKRPKLGDMSDASEIEKEADAIFTLYRDEVYNQDTMDKGIAEIDAVKNRHGPTGTIRCLFEGKYFQFKDFPTRAGDE